MRQIINFQKHIQDQEKDQINGCIYYPKENGYIRWGPSGEWPPSYKEGYKYHITCQEADAAKVAEMVTRSLRAARVFHKLLPNLDDFKSNCRGDQAGKFIVAYLPSPNLQIIKMIDQFMHSENIALGPVPYIRNNDGSKGALEKNVGFNIYCRQYNPTHP